MLAADAAGREGGFARPQALMPHPGRSCVHPGAGLRFSALSQSRKPSEGQGAPRPTEHTAQGVPEAGHPAGPWYVPEAGSGRWWLGWSRAGAAQEVEEHFRTPLGCRKGVTPALGAPRAAQDTELDGAREAGLEQALSPTPVKLFLHGSCCLWCFGGTDTAHINAGKAKRASPWMTSLSREAEPREHHRPPTQTHPQHQGHSDAIPQPARASTGGSHQGAG